jgi:hypothetical protein
MRLLCGYLDEDPQTLESLGLIRGNIRPEPWPHAPFFNVSLHAEADTGPRSSLPLGLDLRRSGPRG